MGISVTRSLPAGGVGIVPGFKTLLVAAGTLAAAVPEIISSTFWVVTVLIILDTLSGAYLAARASNLKSNRLREKLVAKLLQYSLIAAMGGGVGVVTKQWAFFGAALGAIMAVEIVSIMENLLLLEKNGGAPLGPARPFLQKIEKYFAVTSSFPTEDEKDEM